MLLARVGGAASGGSQRVCAPCHILRCHIAGSAAVAGIACWPCPVSMPHLHTGVLGGRLLAGLVALHAC
eukprot:6478540-Amphidinium_carterae.2